MLSPFVISHARHRVILGLFTVNVLWLQIAYGQRLYSSFGQVAERTLGFTPAGLAIRGATPPGRMEVVVLSRSPAALSMYALADSGTIENLASFPLPGPREGLLAEDIDGDGEVEFLTLTADGSAVSLLKRRGKGYAETLFPLATKSQRIAIADVNKDGHKDLLLYGRNRAGVSTLLGRGGGAFSPGPELLGEVPISDLKSLDINGDGIVDIIVANWLSNQITIFYGISNMVFSEEVSISLPGEPGSLALVWLQRRRTLGMAVTLPRERKIVLLRGTPAGDMQIDGTMSIPGRPSGVQFTTINEDAFPDLIVPTDKGTVVSVGAGMFEFYPPTLLAPGAAPRGWAIADVDGDRRPDYVAAEESTQRLVFLANARSTGRVRWPDTYAVGSVPHGLLVDDLDGDGRADIAVANSQSSSISVLFNRGRGKFSGTQTVDAAERPAHLTMPLTPPHAMRALVSSHPETDRVGVVTLSENPLRASSFAIPTGTRPFVLCALQDSERLGILLRYTPRSGGPVSLALFEQIGGHQFLERSLRASLPERISAVTVDRPQGSSSYTISFVTGGLGSHVSTLSHADADQSLNIGSIRQMLSFDDSTSSTRGIIPATLNREGLRDLIIVVGEPVNALGLAFRNADGTFRGNLEWIPDVSITDDDDVVVRDVDGDGYPDITLRNQLVDDVETYYGSDQGFGQKKVICRAHGVRGFAVASLITAGIQDLVLSHYDRGTVSIIYNPFRR